MKASIYELNLTDCRKLKIRDDYSIHRVVYDLFPKLPTGRDFLYRDLGDREGVRKILIFSERNPEAKYGTIKTKEISEKYFDFSKYSFNIKINSAKMKGEKRYSRENDYEWFLKNSNKWGFQILDLQTINKEALVINKGGLEPRTFNSVIFSGVLQIIDKELFKKVFKTGISHAKAYGFGLLQIIPIN